MKQYVIVFIMLLTVSIISGCIEERQEYFLNPDGSGKVIYEITSSMDYTMDLDRTSSSEEDQILKIANSFITLSKGVDAWKDISFRKTDDGQTYFKGAAYFKELSKLEIYGRVRMEDKLTMMTKNPESGCMRIIYNPYKLDEDPERKKRKKVNEKLSPKELADKIKAEKAEYEKKKEMLAAIFCNFRVVNIIHLPGLLDKVKVFKKDTKSDSVNIIYDGEDILRALNELTKNDDWGQSRSLAGPGASEGPEIEEINEKIFGQKAIAFAVVKGGFSPLFDYETEMESARKAYSEMAKKLGLKENVY